MKRVLSALLLLAAACTAQDSRRSDDHYNHVNQRGESPQGMGFSQTETTHHFLLTKDGGIIQVTAKNSADKASIEQVQKHFAHIAQLFAEGDFNIPHFVHAQNPPGVPTMKRLKSEIHYSEQDLPTGARLNLETLSPEARNAIHDFLVFQIRDHRTGDPETVQSVLPLK